ncbi:MAG TPA: adenosine monophosphate-protein transferase, partial [Spirochaetaceae bacterium]|nr:adenosine monophosphate-protein transferase [Spirochaetaceae bacterium]
TNCNIIIGQSHFIKTVEDIAEIMMNSVPGVKFGLAFCEASGPCLVRTEGTDPYLIEVAQKMAMAVRAGHSFYLVIGPGAYPLNVLDRIKANPETCRIFCATANPVEVVRAIIDQGAAILGVVDGFSPKGVESAEDKVARKAMLREFGYKF